MAKTSAGILPYRVTPDGLELFIAHMGGPLWAKRDDRAWSVIKGEYDASAESPEQAARREFTEETGRPVPEGALLELGTVKQSAKSVTAFAVAAPDLDPDDLTPGTFTMQWPPRSGRTAEFPEIDRAAWVDADTARVKLVAAQAAFVDRLLDAVG